MNEIRKRLNEIQSELDKYDDFIESEKKRLEGQDRERTDGSDMYYLDNDEKVIYRKLCMEMGYLQIKGHGSPKERIFIKRSLRRKKIEFDQDMLLEELKKLNV